MTSVLHDPWTGATVHDDALPSPIVDNDANGDYIIHRENGKSTYKAYEGGGSELPEVTADDNGDVLTVVSGEWAKAAPSGGGALVCNADQSGTLDHTWQEIHDAMPLAYVISPNGDYCPVIVAMYGGGMYGLTIANLQGDSIAHTSFVTDSADGYPVYNEA